MSELRKVEPKVFSCGREYTRDELHQLEVIAEKAVHEVDAEFKSFVKGDELPPHLARGYNARLHRRMDELAHAAGIRTQTWQRGAA